jgi:hypothetical protein
MKNLSLPAANNQSSVISIENDGTTSNRLWGSNYQRNSRSCNCNKYEFNIANRRKYGLSKYHRQANIPTKEKTLTNIFSNVFYRFSFLRNESFKQLNSSQKFSQTLNNNNKSSTKDRPLFTSFLTSSSVMKIKIFRRNISPKPQEVEASQSSSDLSNQRPSSSVPAVTNGNAKKKLRTKR